MNGWRSIVTFLLILVTASSFAQSKKQLLSDGITAFERQDYQGSIDLLDQLIEKTDRDSTAFFYRGMGYARLESYAEAHIDLFQGHRHWTALF